MKSRLVFYFAIMVGMVFGASVFVVSLLGFCFKLSLSTIGVISCLVSSLALSYIISDKVADRTGSFSLKWVSGACLGSLSVAFSVSILGWGLIFFGAKPYEVGILSLVAILSLSILGLFLNARLPKVNSHQLTLQKLTQPLRLVQLSDLHFNGLKTQAWTEKLVQEVNQLNPDYILFTGDFFDVATTHLKPHLQILKDLKATKGKFAVSGNHDFYSGYRAYCSMMTEIGFTLMDNMSFSDDALCLIGLPDQQGRSEGVKRLSLDELIPASKQALPIVLLDHRPQEAKRALKKGVDLQLSGHTHKGQIPPWNVLVRLRYRYSAGLYKKNQSYVFTSIGTGSWGPPMRLFSRSEIVCLDLVGS